MSTNKLCRADKVDFIIKLVIVAWLVCVGTLLARCQTPPTQIDPGQIKGGSTTNGNGLGLVNPLNVRQLVCYYPNAKTPQLCQLSITDLPTLPVTGSGPADLGTATGLLDCSKIKQGCSPWSTSSSAGSPSPTPVSGSNPTFLITFTPNAIQIGGNCTVSAPCLVRFGSVSYFYTAPIPVSVTGNSTGMVNAYVTPSGIGVGTTPGVTALCSSLSGCMVSQSIAMPPGSIPLGTWTYTQGSLDSGGFTNYQTTFSNTPIKAGVGITAADVNGTTVIGVDTTSFPVLVSPPPSSNSSCVPGNWSYDSGYVYVCFALNQWGRSALQTGW